MIHLLHVYVQHHILLHYHNYEYDLLQYILVHVHGLQLVHEHDLQLVHEHVQLHIL